MRRLSIGVAISLLTVSSNMALAEGDPEAGEKVFNKCKTCHVVDAEKNKIGPHLVGIIGRPAGSIEDFKYSAALKESGIVWDKESLAPYLANPREVIPGGRMAFVGLKKEQEIADVIAYLEQASATN